MRELIVSSKGQIVLPADLRRRHGIEAGARLEVIESPEGLTLRVARAAALTDVAALAGMATAPARRHQKRLEDFDAASLLAGKTQP